LPVCPLLRNVDANAKITGPCIQAEQQIKMLSYADDVVAIVKGQESIREIFFEYERLFLQSGLKLNGSKTECLSLGEPIVNPPRIIYLGQSFLLSIAEQIKVCGNVLSLDRDLRYNENVIKKIDKLVSILGSWSRRNLTPYGRMIILKTFALSQLVFVSQHSNISTNDVRKIEAICYKFVWGGKPDRIKRAVLKNSKEHGGINGIDVDCFLKAIKVRQFLKAEMKSELLRVIQNSPNVYESISVSARQSIRKLYRVNYESLDPFALNSPSKDTLASIANLNILGFVKVGSKAEKVMIDNGIYSFAQLTDSEIPRGKMNLLLKSLPAYLKAFLLQTYDYEQVRFGYFDGVNVILLHKFTTKKLQLLLMKAFGKCKPPRIWNDQINIEWKRIWRIKNPTLRSIRYKVAHGDVFCNLRRFQCKVSDSDKCDICSLPETIEHQLFLCTNAQKMWTIANKVLEREINNIAGLVELGGSDTDELIKSVIIKFLLQIDRSAGITARTLLQRIRYYLEVEKSVRSNFALLNRLEIVEFHMANS